jgi:hypothetical protein
MAGHSKWSEIKRRKGLTEGRERARQASLRAIADGDRPAYRPQVEPGHDVLLVRIPELDITTEARQPGEVSAMARECIASWLGVDPDAVDVEI